MDIVLAKCPPMSASNGGAPSEAINLNGMTESQVLGVLVSLHCKIKAATARVRRNQSQVRNNIFLL
jgi:hypothetical protein